MSSENLRDQFLDCCTNLAKLISVVLKNAAEALFIMTINEGPKAIKGHLLHHLSLDIFHKECDGYQAGFCKYRIYVLQWAVFMGGQLEKSMAEYPETLREKLRVL